MNSKEVEHKHNKHKTGCVDAFNGHKAMIHLAA